MSAGRERNSFAAGALSVSLLWGISSILLRAKRKSVTVLDHEKYNLHNDDKDDVNVNDNDHSQPHDNAFTTIARRTSTSTSKSNAAADAAIEIMHKIVHGTKIIRERWQWESLRAHAFDHIDNDNDNDDHYGDFDDDYENDEENDHYDHGGQGGIEKNTEKQGTDNGTRTVTDTENVIKHNNNNNTDTSNTDNRNIHENDEQKNDTCIGSIFGLDVGGTLSKLLYFEEKTQSPLNIKKLRYLNHERNNDDNDWDHDTDHSHGTESARVKLKKKWQSQSEYHINTYANDACNGEGNCDENQHQTGGLIGLSLSNDDSVDPQFLDKPPSIVSSESNASSIVDSKEKQNRKLHEFNSKQDDERQQALERFYAFVRNLDTSAGTGTDTNHFHLKDTSRSFYSRTLGGEFHFIQFETRHISQAMDLIKSTNLHLDIAEVGATGGGAHKYADRWDKHLGIKINKQDELESLVTGMQFVLADVVGECYTFSPKEQGKENGNVHAPLDTQDTGITSTSLVSTSSSPDSELDNDLGSEHRRNKQKDKETTLGVSSASVDYSKPIENNSYNNNSSNSSSGTNSKPSEHGEGSSKKIHGLDQYWWSRKVKRDFIIDSDSFPYLLVMIGTGVSVLRVDGPRQHERISGSTIGGGTYWGLCRLLTDAESFEGVLNLAERGNPAKVDM